MPQDVRERRRALIEHMRGRGTAGMSTDEIMALTRGEPVSRVLADVCTQPPARD